jgi:acyl dehydratase
VTRAHRPDALVPGSEYAAVVVENLSRAQIVQYAGVSGDCSPQHVDEEYARRVGGYPTVFAHGMLTMAAAGRLVTDLVGDGKVVTFGMRFLGQVWPGDSLTARARVREPESDGPAEFVRLTLTVVNQHGQPVASGYATALVDGLVGELPGLPPS